MTAPHTTTAAPVLSVPDAERLAERMLAAIDNDQQHSCLECPELLPYIRERVDSDLAGLRAHPAEYDEESIDFRLAVCNCDRWWPCDDARRYSDGLRRTAALYGVTNA